MNEGCERERGKFPEAEGAQCFAASQPSLSYRDQQRQMMGMVYTFRALTLVWTDIVR